MIQEYEKELEEYRLRLLEMEQAEIQRLAEEAAYKEELAKNGGKPLSYFQVPKLNTKTRSIKRQRFDRPIR